MITFSLTMVSQIISSLLFLTKFLCTFHCLAYASSMVRSSQPLHLITVRVFRESTSSSRCLIPTSCYFPPSIFSIGPSILSSVTLKLCSFLRVRDQVSHLHKDTDNFIILFTFRFKGTAQFQRPVYHSITYKCIGFGVFAAVIFRL
jgi:hypothetical protein